MISVQVNRIDRKLIVGQLCGLLVAGSAPAAGPLPLRSDCKGMAGCDFFFFEVTGKRLFLTGKHLAAA